MVTAGLSQGQRFMARARELPAMRTVFAVAKVLVDEGKARRKEVQKCLLKNKHGIPSAPRGKMVGAWVALQASQ